MAMDPESGKLKMVSLEDYKKAELGKLGSFHPVPKEGEVVRFEGTRLCFRIKRVTPVKVILKPVPESEYIPNPRLVIKPNADDGHFDV